MELDGHPTHDLVGELLARGGHLYQGTARGPDPRRQDLQPALDPNEVGLWLYLPPGAYNTGFDEPAPIT